MSWLKRYRLFRLSEILPTTEAAIFLKQDIPIIAEKSRLDNFEV